MYKITCTFCEANDSVQSHVGESKRPIHYRFNEHLGDTRLRKTGTPLGDHILRFHVDVSNEVVNSCFKIEILSVDRDVAEANINESIHIRDITSCLNTMTSSWPLVRSVG